MRLPGGATRRADGRWLASPRTYRFDPSQTTRSGSSAPESGPRIQAVPVILGHPPSVARRSSVRRSLGPPAGLPISPAIHFQAPNATALRIDARQNLASIVLASIETPCSLIDISSKNGGLNSDSHGPPINSEAGRSPVPGPSPRARPTSSIRSRSAASSCRRKTRAGRTAAGS